MSKTWSTLRTEIARKLNDPSMATYTAAMLLDAVNDALSAFAASHTGVASDVTLTGDGTTYTFDLPTDMVDSENAGIYAVQWKEQEWIYPERFWWRVKWPATERSTTSKPKAYVLWPRGSISFTQIPGSGDAIILHYIAYYEEVLVVGDIIDVPRWAFEAIKCYVCSVTLSAAFAKSANIRQWNQREDSGEPEDNPLLRLAKYYMTRYFNLLTMHPEPQYNQDIQPEDYR